MSFLQFNTRNRLIGDTGIIEAMVDVGVMAFFRTSTFDNRCCMRMKRDDDNMVKIPRTNTLLVP